MLTIKIIVNIQNSILARHTRIIKHALLTRGFQPNPDGMYLAFPLRTETGSSCIASPTEARLEMRPLSSSRPRADFRHWPRHSLTEKATFANPIGALSGGRPRQLERGAVPRESTEVFSVVP